MKKILIVLAIVLAVSALLYGAYTHFISDRPKEIRATFVCEQGKKFDVIFFFADTAMADVTLSDGRNYLLSQGMSASGARYVNSDESFVLWVKGDRAFIEENGKETYRGAVK